MTNREQELNEAAEKYGLSDGIAFVDKKPIYTPDKFIGNPQQYSNVTIQNKEAVRHFKAGAEWQAQRDAERAKILVEAIQSYLEVQKFLAKPDDDNCVSSSDFRIALRKYNGEN